MHPFTIATPKGPRTIGPGHPCFMIAELSANHLGDFDRACAILDSAADAGADAIKLQTYTADTMTIKCSADPFQVKINDAWRGNTLYELYEKAHTPWAWHRALKERADARGLVFFSSPFDASSIELLETLEVPLYKVASLEINYIQLLEEIGARRKPVIISRGLAAPSEIKLALDTLYSAGAPSIAILHCVSSYPAVVSQMKLRTIPDLATRFNCVTGLSDHSLARSVPITAVALGAHIIEKHLCLKRADGGPDAAFSLEPHEFRTMVDDVRECEESLGLATYQSEEVEGAHGIFRRSIMVVRDVEIGEEFTADNLAVIRPGLGLQPKELSGILGKCARRYLPRGTPTSWGDICE